MLIPITFLLMNYYGIYGVYAAMAISELLMIIIVEATRKLLQNHGKLSQKGLLMILKPEHDDLFNSTIEATEKNAIGISEKIIEYCQARNVDERTAYVLGLSAEEIVQRTHNGRMRRLDEKYRYRLGHIGKSQVHGLEDKSEWIMGEVFMKYLANSTKTICDHFGKHIIFINVMRRISVDCDCAGVEAEEPTIADIGICASTDILIIDQACVDMV